MRNTRIYLIALLILLLPSQILMLNSPLFPSHDGLYHIERINQFHQAITQGQIPPRLAASLLDTIGYPLFIANYQLPYYLAEIFMFTTDDPTLSYKAIMSISYLLSGVFAFLFFKTLGSNLTALTGAIIASYLPYRFANLYTRGSLGETVAFMFLPLVFLAINLIFAKKSGGILLLALAVFGLITSHTVVFLLFAPFVAVYTLLILKLDAERLTQVILGTIWGIALSSFQLLPSIFEKQFLKFDQNLIGLYQNHFLNFYQLLRIPQPNVNIGTPFQVGLAASLIFILSLRSQAARLTRQMAFFTTAAIVSFFLIMPQSTVLWDNLPLIKYILYPWRFLSIIVFSISFLSVYLVNRSSHQKILAIFLIAISIFTSRHYWAKPTQREANIPLPTLTTQNEYDTVWSNEVTFKPRPAITSIPNTEVADLTQNGLNLSFNIKINSPTEVTIRRLYFPGWKIKANGQERNLSQTDGLLSFAMPPGDWQIDAYFNKTPLRKIADWISAFAFLLFGLFLLNSIYYKMSRGNRKA